MTESSNHNLNENKAINNAQSINRKEALEKITKTGKKVLYTALPFSLIGLSAKQSKAQFRDLEVARAFNFLLLIEFMQAALYLQATNRNGLIGSGFQEIFFEIRQQHQGRIIIINNTVGSLGLDPTPAGGFNFNFRSGAGFDPFDSFDNFLNLAQIVEDLSAGVYKKQAEIIYQNNPSSTIKQLILQLHSTEARHAYYIRYLRAQRGLDNIKGWINQTDLGNLSDSFANIYANEGNTTQEGIDVPSITQANVQAVQEAWDEPIDRGLANSILQLFTRPL